MRPIAARAFVIAMVVQEAGKARESRRKLLLRTRRNIPHCRPHGRVLRWAPVSIRVAHP